VAAGSGARISASVPICASSREPACLAGVAPLGAVTVIVAPSVDYLVCGQGNQRTVMVKGTEPMPSTSAADAIDAYVDTAPGVDYQPSADEAAALVSQGDGTFIAYVSLHRWDNGGWAIDSVVECSSAS